MLGFKLFIPYAIYYPSSQFRNFLLFTNLISFSFRFPTYHVCIAGRSLNLDLHPTPQLSFSFNIPIQEQVENSLPIFAFHYFPLRRKLSALCRCSTVKGAIRELSFYCKWWSYLTSICIDLCLYVIYFKFMKALSGCVTNLVYVYVYLSILYVINLVVVRSARCRSFSISIEAWCQPLPLH